MLKGTEYAQSVRWQTHFLGAPEKEVLMVIQLAIVVKGRVNPKSGIGRIMAKNDWAYTVREIAEYVFWLAALFLCLHYGWCGGN